MREWTREEKYRYLKNPQELSDLYAKVSASAWRQKYHNQPVTGLMNDPNGFVWHDGRAYVQGDGDINERRASVGQPVYRNDRAAEGSLERTVPGVSRGLFCLLRV